MPLFEQAPWILIPVIIVTAEAWNALKDVVSDALRRRVRASLRPS